MTTQTVSTITVAPLSNEDNDWDLSNCIRQDLHNMDSTLFGCLSSPPSSHFPIVHGVRLNRCIVKMGGRATRGNIEITITGIDSYALYGYSTDKWGIPKKEQFKYEKLTRMELWNALRRIWE